MGATGIDLGGIAHLKLGVIAHQKMQVRRMAGILGLRLSFDQCEGCLFQKLNNRVGSIQEGIGVKISVCRVIFKKKIVNTLLFGIAEYFSGIGIDYRIYFFLYRTDTWSEHIRYLLLLFRQHNLFLKSSLLLFFQFFVMERSYKYNFCF